MTSNLIGKKNKMAILDKLITLEEDASNFGFRWDNTDQLIDQIKSECDEINVHLQHREQSKDGELQEEIGDLLHAVFSLCVFCQFDPQDTLEKSVNKFERRFNTVKKLAYEQGLVNLKGKSFQELMVFWDEAKKLQHHSHQD